jgi:hypothetical protein
MGWPLAGQATCGHLLPRRTPHAVRLRFCFPGRHIRFNFTVPREGHIGVYLRKNVPATFAQFEFVGFFADGKLASYSEYQRVSSSGAMGVRRGVSKGVRDVDRPPALPAGHS